MKYEAILFDMDGTVLDTVDDLRDAMNHSLALFGMPPIDRARAEAGLGYGTRHFVASSLPAGSSEELIDEVKAVYIPYYSTCCRVKTVPYAGILPLMEALKEAGIPMGIVSNKPDSVVRELAARFFSGLVECAVGEKPGVRRKPNPDAALAAADGMGVRAENCLYVGDTEVDLRTAVNAGMDCAAVCWGFRTAEQLRAAGAEKLFFHPDELREYLLG